MIACNDTTAILIKTFLIRALIKTVDKNKPICNVECVNVISNFDVINFTHIKCYKYFHNK
jgi:hypothetical protein